MFVLICFLKLWKKSYEMFSECHLTKDSSSLEKLLSSNMELYFQITGEEPKPPEGNQIRKSVTGLLMFPVQSFSCFSKIWEVAQQGGYI